MARKRREDVPEAQEPVASEAPASVPAALPPAEPSMPLVEFEAISGIGRVPFAGFKAYVAVNGLKKQRTASEWRRLYAKYAGM